MSICWERRNINEIIEIIEINKFSLSLSIKKDINKYGLLNILYKYNLLLSRLLASYFLF